jgi:NhaP-type Na+/H+ or K+/H+ antiporter
MADNLCWNIFLNKKAIVMAENLAALIVISFIIAYLFKYVKTPPLIGMLLLGILAGPYVFGWMDPSLLAISSDLRMGALIVIILRAGFELSKDTLMKVGKPALLLSFIPAVFEGAAITFLGPVFLPLTRMESAILGAVLAAVSPAVVVPLMIRFIEEKRGTDKGIPTLVLAGSSIDDVFVIVIYSVLIGIYTGKQMNLVWELASIPVSIVVGIAVGLATGAVLYKIFDRYNPPATHRVLTILSVAVLLMSLERLTKDYVPFAALLAVMTIGYIILKNRSRYAHEVSAQLAKLWVPAEIVLFVMVGAQVNVKVALDTGLNGALLIFIALIFRSIGTWMSMLGTDLTPKERLFVVISYIPKATVQAAIGGAPLLAMKAAGMSTAPGETILAVAVLSILLTAPLGAWGIMLTAPRLLKQEK